MDYERMERVVDGNMEAIMESRQFLYDVELTDKTKEIIRQALTRAYSGGYMAHMYAAGEMDRQRDQGMTPAIERGR